MEDLSFNPHQTYKWAEENQYLTQAKVLSRFVDGIMIRAIEHDDVVELAEYSDVPVISGLTNLEHPCQALADMLTIKEHLGEFKGKKLCFVGDGNNVCNSLLLITAILEWICL